MRHRGAGILYTDGKEILLLFRSAEASAHPNTWAPTGGRIEKGEDVLEAAKRESREEIGTLQGKQIAKFNDAFIMFIFKVTKPFDVRLNKEHTKYKWVKLDEVEGLKLHPNFKKEWPNYRQAIEKSKRSFKEWLNVNHSGRVALS